MLTHYARVYGLLFVADRFVLASTFSGNNGGAISVVTDGCGTPNPYNFHFMLSLCTLFPLC